MPRPLHSRLPLGGSATAGRQVADDDLLERGRSPDRLLTDRQEGGYPDEGEALPGRGRERPDDRLRGSLAGRLRRRAFDDPMMGDRLGDREVEERMALAEHDQPIARLLDVRDHVRRQERRRPGGPDGLDHEMEELATGEWIEARQRLIEQEDLGSGREGEGETDLCLLAARQLARTRTERDRQPLDVSRSHRFVESAAERRRQRDVLSDGQIAVERRRLGNVADAFNGTLAVSLRIDAAGDEAAFGCALEADPGADQSRLARAIRPDEGRDAALRHREVDTAQRPRPPSIALAEPLGFENRRHPSLRLVGCRTGPGGASRP
ncbi:MAG TPA: hypothetical protein VHS36_05165 [Candidatus Limnocylindrales bacterium]|nr:hypothetical protein [Candidatus Limnocylindrales bacterium]